MTAFANQGQNQRLLKELVLCSARKIYLRIKPLLTSNTNMPKFKLHVTNTSVDIEIVQLWVICRF